MEKGVYMEKLRRTHLFIINPRSFRYVGGPDRIMAEIRAYFQGNTEEEHRIHVSRYPRDAIGVIRKFAATVPDGVITRVYAVGGDGTLFDCLNGIVELPNMELAVMSYGSSNDFMLSFGEGKAELFRDIAKQVSAGTIKTDIFHCGSNYAMNTCTVGVEAAAVLNAVRLMQTFAWAIRITRRIVAPLYTLGGILAILDRRIREQRYRISLDGERIDSICTCINIANGPYCGGGMSAVTSAMPNDGFMDALFLKSGTPPQILRMLPRYLRGGYYKYPDFFSYRRMRKVEISSDTPISVNLDGEAFLDMNITIEVIPQAVDVVAPDGVVYERRPDAREPQQ
jgi:diacylglycerol kinase family enzyme